MAQAQFAAGIVGQAGQLLAPDDHAPVRWGVEPGDQVEERALARAARAHDGKELAGRHLQAHVAQCGDRVAGITVALADPLENDRTGVRHDLTRSGGATAGSVRRPPSMLCPQ